MKAYPLELRIFARSVSRHVLNFNSFGLRPEVERPNVRVDRARLNSIDELGMMNAERQR